MSPLLAPEDCRTLAGNNADAQPENSEPAPLPSGAGNRFHRKGKSAGPVQFDALWPFCVPAVPTANSSKPRSAHSPSTIRRLQSQQFP